MATGILYGAAYGARFRNVSLTQHGGEFAVYFLPGIFNIRTAAFGNYVFTNGDAIHVGTVGVYNSNTRTWTFQDYTPTRVQLNQLALTRNYIYGKPMPATLDGVRMIWHETQDSTITLNPFKVSMPVLDTPATIKIGELITGFDVDTSGSAPIVSAIYKTDQILTLSDMTIGTGYINGIQIDGDFSGTYSVTNIFAGEYSYNPQTGTTATKVVQYIDGTTYG